MGTKPTTIHDLAKFLGISASTVSRALQNSPLINAETKKKVKEAATLLNYQANVLAYNLRKGNSKTIGVMVPRIDNHFFSSVISGIEKVLNDEGYNLLIVQALDSVEKEIMNIQSLLTHRIAGLLASPSALNDRHEHFEKVIEKNIPLIFFDNAFLQIPVSSVMTDDVSGAKMATEHLIKQGCKKIWYVGGPSKSIIYRRRLEGFVKSMENHGIWMDHNWIFQNENAFINAKEFTSIFIKENNRPDGVFFVTDHQAIEFIRELKNQNINPEDACITGFSNAYFSDLIDPPLTTVDQHSLQMGEITAKLLLEEFELRKEGKFEPKRIELKPELLVRKSSLRN